MATDNEKTAMELPCPVCGAMTDSLKWFASPIVLFIVIGASIKRRQFAACPSCMRKKVKETCLVNLPTANLIWPIIIWPMTVVQLRQSRSKGHSKEILKRLGLESETQTAAAEPATLGPWAKRILGVVKLLVATAITVGIGTLLLNSWYEWRGAIWGWAALAAVGVGAACALAYRGVMDVLLKSAGRKTYVLVTLAAAVVFFAASPLLARAHWKAKADEYLGQGYLFEYSTYVPPQFWTVEGATKVFDWKSGVVKENAGVGGWQTKMDYEDIMGLVRELETSHGEDAEFAPLIARANEFLDEYMHLMDDLGGGMMGGVPAGMGK